MWSRRKHNVSRPTFPDWHHCLPNCFTQLAAHSRCWSLFLDCHFFSESYGVLYQFKCLIQFFETHHVSIKHVQDIKNGCLLKFQKQLLCNLATSKYKVIYSLTRSMPRLSFFCKVLVSPAHFFLTIFSMQLSLQMFFCFFGNKFNYFFSDLWRRFLKYFVTHFKIILNQSSVLRGWTDFGSDTGCLLFKFFR